MNWNCPKLANQVFSLKIFFSWNFILNYYLGPIRQLENQNFLPYEGLVRFEEVRRIFPSDTNFLGHYRNMRRYYRSPIFVQKFWKLQYFSYNRLFKTRRLMRNDCQNAPIQFIFNKVHPSPKMTCQLTEFCLNFSKFRSVIKIKINRTNSSVDRQA